MSTATETNDALQEAIEPVAHLREEQGQLTDCVRDSFDALEALQVELTQWQEELTGQQAELEAKQAELDERDQQQNSSAELAEAHVKALEEELDELRNELTQLEEEGSDQLQALEELEREAAVARAELEAEREHTAQLKAIIEEADARTARQNEQWSGEFAALRELIEKQSKLIEGRCSPTPKEVSVGQPSETSAKPRSRASELRERAKSRQASQRRKKTE